MCRRVRIRKLLIFFFYSLSMMSSKKELAPLTNAQAYRLIEQLKGMGEKNGKK